MILIEGKRSDLSAEEQMALLRAADAPMDSLIIHSLSELDALADDLQCYPVWVATVSCLDCKSDITAVMMALQGLSGRTPNRFYHPHTRPFSRDVVLEVAFPRGTYRWHEQASDGLGLALRGASELQSRATEAARAASMAKRGHSKQTWLTAHAMLDEGHSYVEVAARTGIGRRTLFEHRKKARP